MASNGSSSPWRLSYAVSKPFSKTATCLLLLYAGFVICALTVFTFFTQAKTKLCLSRPSATYSNSTCAPASLQLFGGPYYTRPVSSAGSVGLLPWSPEAFGVDDGKLDYSILSLNWTNAPLICTFSEQVLTLDLGTGSSTMGTCYYCGANLRILCTTVDSDRTSIAADAQKAYTNVLAQFGSLAGLAYRVAYTAMPNATVTAVRVARHGLIPSLGSDVLPMNQETMTVSLTTTIGALPIFANSTPSGSADVAVAAGKLSDYIISVTDADLNGGRSLLVQYLCQDCQDVYKSTKEIISVLLVGVSSLLATFWAVGRIVMEFFHERALRRRGYSSPYMGGAKPPMVGLPVHNLPYAPPSP